MTDFPAIFRRATAEDAVAVARLHARSWQATYRGLVPDEIIARVVREEATRAERFRELFADPDDERRGWVTTHQEAVVGMAISGPSHDPDASDRTGEIEAIYLEPEFIGRGIGRSLLAHVANDLRDQGFEEATLWVLDSNTRARRSYEAAGWRFDGSTKYERPGGVLHEVRYRRTLSVST